MPRKREHTERYADALATLAAATHRPTNVVNYGDDYAIRVEFAFGRYLLATNTEAGLSDDPDVVAWWMVRFFDLPDDVTPVHESRAHWLVDAFDDAVDALRSAGNWSEPEGTLDLHSVDAPRVPTPG